ncbi:MAG: hypothetical protein ACM3X1_05580 [Ignavibacteriales bacterium]
MVKDILGGTSLNIISSISYSDESKEALIPNISISADVIGILPAIKISSEENSRGANLGQIIVNVSRNLSS